MSEKNEAAILREMIRVLVRKTGILERGEAECCSITISQCHALVEVGRKNKLSINQLAEWLGLEKSTVSRSVDKLVGDGLVARQENPEDRRYATLELTERGQEMYLLIEEKMSDYFQQVLSAIPVKKRAHVLDSLEYLTKALEQTQSCECGRGLV